ncbi:MAG: hypothetical protein BRD46_00680 [Bacteroidetes bacterium QS_8_68_15]|nr:MAG: hypothetical protein BRD46_00680 [Bacteroidetes bacterium QS_8_68_15]
MADSSFSTLKARLSTDRPVSDRVLFGLALLGALVAVHLLIQQGRGFDRGCLGFSEPAAAQQAGTFNCEMVTQSGAGTLLGVSNAWWGIGFYLAVAGLSTGAAFAARVALLTGGLAYSAYLTYHQFAGLGALCALCLTSAAIALTLFLVQAVALARPAPSSSATAAPSFADSSPEPVSAMTDSSMTASSSRRPALWAGAALALLVLVGADVAYFSSLEPADADQPVASAETGAPATAPQAPSSSSEGAPADQQQQQQKKQTPAKSTSAAPSPSAAAADTTPAGWSASATRSSELPTRR